MTLYQNGRIPQGNLIKIASGTDVNGYWEHLISPATLRKWNAALAYARRKWGKVMRISTGWNVYRPYAVQTDARKRACAAGNCNAASIAGWSSHGGTWRNSTYTRGLWVDALAIDVVRQELTWAQVDEAMRHAGFLVGAITKAIAGIDEPWHYIDLDPWAAVPTTTPTKEAEVIPYHRQDPNARGGGRSLTRGSSFWLNTTKGAGTSKASNIVGAVGEYSITLHVYATGTPGDVVEVVLAWDNTKTVAPHSMHYVERLVIDKDGRLNASREFKREVPAGYAVYARASAPKTNKGTVKVTVFDSDAHCYTS